MIYSIQIPFKENCKAGCPCDDFECNDIIPETTTDVETTTSIVPLTTAPSVGNAVLVLNKYNSGNKPFVVDFDGEFWLIQYLFYKVCLGNVNNDLAFEYEEGTKINQGCGATLLGEFWYFGGYGSNKRQVS